jgi:sulfur-oxidizing protein SoxB
MVRVGGLKYAIDPRAAIGRRISNMTLAGRALEAGKTYKVAGWAPVSEDARAAGGEAIWDVMARYLRAQKRIGKVALNVPRVEGAAGNPGMG